MERKVQIPKSMQWVAEVKRFHDMSDVSWWAKYVLSRTGEGDKRWYL